jgi:hypothetical protein
MVTAMRCYALDGGTIYLAILMVYIVLLGAQVYAWMKSRGTWGSVEDREGRSLIGVELGLYDVTYDRLVDTRVSDEKGKYRFVVVGGEYVIRPVGRDHVIDDSGYEAGYLVGEKTDKELLITEHVVVRKTGGGTGADVG